MTDNKFTANLYDVLKNQIIDSATDTSNKIEEILKQLKKQNDALSDQFNKIDNEEIQKCFEIIKNYQHQKLIDSIEFFPSRDRPFIAFDLNNYRTELEEFLKKQPLNKRKEQSRDRFHILKKDKARIRILKVFKKSTYLISTLPGRFANVIRKLFRKPAVKLKYWPYIIPYRSIVSYQTEYLLTIQVKEVIHEFSQNSIANLREALSKEQQLNDQLIKNPFHLEIDQIKNQNLKLDLDPYLKSQRKELNNLKSNLEELIDECYEDVTELSAICNTLEYPKAYLQYQNRKRRKNKAFKRLNSSLVAWGNTAFALLEDWKIDQEIYNLNFFSKQKIDLLTKEYQDHNQMVIELLQNSKAKILQLNHDLQIKLSANQKNASQIINAQLNNLKKNLSVDNFEKASEILIKFNLPERIAVYENKIDEFLKEISEKRWLTKLTVYNQPLQSSDLDSFSPRELISFEYLKEFISSCNTIKSQAVKQIDSIQQSISNIEHVVAFNLSSIIESMERGECELKDIPKLVDEGLERSQNKVDEIVRLLENFERETYEALIKNVKAFLDSNLKLTVNENAFNLRMIVMKAKAIQRSEEFGTEVISKLKTLNKQLNVNFRKLIAKAERILIPWKKRIGFDVTDSEVATELSNFLQEAITKINSLPIIYQRLYKIIPLTEMSFFTGRTVELETLQKAYKSWKEGKYSPTVVIGEKRSGHTTLINYFLEKQLGIRDVIVINRKQNILTSEELFSFLSDTLEEPGIKSYEDCVTVLKQKHRGKVIVMENLQNYYLRVISGFDALKMLIKLISSTSRDIFWICSANIYAWKYLNSTLDISGFFGYVTDIQTFSSDELRSLIMKKNNISGYRIIFSPSEKNLSSKKYQRLNDEERQTYLRNRFFNDLNDFAQGNISLALTFWLLSTTNITEDSIEIINFKPPDFSFINKLDTEKVFIIYILIMHDGLTFEQLNKIYSKPQDKLQLYLMMMLDDGIIVDNNDIYEVNPLIYRNSINMLKSRNLIY